MFAERSSPVNSNPTNSEELKKPDQPVGDAANQRDWEAIAAAVKAEQAAKQPGNLLPTPAASTPNNPDNNPTQPIPPESPAPTDPQPQTPDLNISPPPSPSLPENNQTADGLEETRRTIEKIRAEENVISVAREKLERVADIQEILRRGPRNAEELIHLTNAATYQQLFQNERIKKYGEGFLGRVKEFLAGERDFRVDEDGQIRRTGWNGCAEAGRKVLQTVFNRRTVAATGVAAILGVLTGGVGAAAGGVIFGSMAGRGTAELVDSLTGGEREARRKVMEAEKERWHELKRLSAEVSQTEDPAKKAELMTQITDIYYRQGEKSVVTGLKLAQENFEKQQQQLNKLRSRLQTVGEIGGLGAGVLHGFLTGRFAPIDIDLWHKVPNQSIMHEVVKVGDAWHFAYTTAEKAAGIGGGQLTHLLGEPAWKIGVATAVERGAPVLMAAFSAAVFGRKTEERARTAREQYQARMAESQRRQVVDTIPKPPTPEPAPTKPEEEQWTPEKLQKRADELGVIMPEGPSDLPAGWLGQPDRLAQFFSVAPNGEIKTDKFPEWQKIDANGKPLYDQENKPILARIISVDPSQNRIVVIKKFSVDEKKHIFFEPQPLRLDQFLKEHRPRIKEVKERPETKAATAQPAPSPEPTPSQPERSLEEKVESMKQALVGQEIPVQFQQQTRGNRIIAQPQLFEHQGERYRLTVDDWTLYNNRVQQEERFQEAMVIDDVMIQIPQRGERRIVIKVRPKERS